MSFLSTEVNKWKRVRVGVILEGSSGNLTVSAAAIYGNTEDGIAAATTMTDLPATPTTRTSDGAAYPASYADLDVSAQLTEIGVKVRNTSGGRREMGRLDQRVFVPQSSDFAKRRRARLSAKPRSFASKLVIK